MRTYPLLFLLSTGSDGALVWLKKKKKKQLDTTSLKATIRKSVVCIFASTPFGIQAQMLQKPELNIDSLLYQLSVCKDDTARIKTLEQLALTYSAINPDEGLKYGEQALGLSQQIQWKPGLVSSYAKLAINYQAKSQHAEALKNLKESLRISRELNADSSIAVNTGNIGEAYFEMARDTSAGSLQRDKHSVNLVLAISYLEDAIRICKQLNYLEPAVEYTQYLSEAYYLAGRHKHAFLTYKDHIALKETLASSQKQTWHSKLETQREIDLKNKSIIIKNKELEINKLVVATKRNERILYISVICLITIVTVVAIREYQRRSRIHRETLAHIARIQSHDLRGPLATILGLAQLFNHDTPSDPINKKVIESITITCKKLDDIIRDIVIKTTS